MRKLSLWVFMTVLALGLNLSTGPAKAEPEDKPEAPSAVQVADDDGTPRLEALNLTAEQIQKLRDHRTVQRKDMIKLRAELEAKQVDLAAELGQDPPDRKKIDQLAKQMGEVHARMILARTDAIIFLRSILTPEQRQRMDENFLNPEKGYRFMHRKSKTRGR